MADLLIKESELPQLDAIIGEIPFKHANRLVAFLQAASQKRIQEEQSKKVVKDQDVNELGSIQFKDLKEKEFKGLKEKAGN